MYSNFKNKEDLFLALLEDAYAKDTAAIKETLGGLRRPARGAPR